MKQVLIPFCFFIFFIPGCFNHRYKKDILNGYALYAYEANEDMTLMHFDKYGGLDIITPTVFSIGYNKDFIIAKQHPTIYPAKENKSITNYFIVPLKQPVKWTDQEIGIGPLTESEFIKMRKKLNVADSLNFSIIYDDVK
ncbi:MAG: hypothetical protein ABJA35_16895 [Parafilimonas sp.]